MNRRKLSLPNCFFVAILLLAVSPVVLAYHGEVSIDLKGLLNAAWTQNGSALVFEQKKEALTNKLALSNQFFPSSAQMSGSFSSDGPFKNDGRREYGLSIGSAIWLPGQRKVLGAEVEAEIELLLAEEIFQRWQLTGKVREHYWNVMLARNELRLATRKLKISQKLVANVSQRVKAGELAEIDLLLSMQKSLTAESEQLSAKQRLARAQLLFNGLTGLDAPEDWLSEVEQNIPLEEHPLLVSLSKQLKLSRVNFEKIRRYKRKSPRVALGLARERDDRDADYINSLGIQVTLPFENRVLNKSKFTAAQVVKTTIEADYFQKKHKLTKSIELAQLKVTHAKKTFETFERLKSLAVKHLKLMQRAFNIGEVGLRELLLVQNDSDQAVDSSARQRVEVARAISQLNQEQGAFP